MMRTKAVQFGILVIEWDHTDAASRKAAREEVLDRMKKGWDPSNLTPERTWTVKELKSPSFYRNGAIKSVTLADILESVLRVEELSSIMDYLRHLGLKPSIYTRGRKLFRFHVNAGGNFWADHIIADEACAMAVKEWTEAGRPLTG